MIYDKLLNKVSETINELKSIDLKMDIILDKIDAFESIGIGVILFSNKV